MTDEEYKLAREHRDTLNNIQTVLKTPEGKNFVKYLFKELEVCESPPEGWTGEILMERLGFQRAGNSVFKLVSEANPGVAGELIALVEKERHAMLYLGEEDGD